MNRYIGMDDDMMYVNKNWEMVLVKNKPGIVGELKSAMKKKKFLNNKAKQVNSIFS